jgi:aerobic carbon-monoxide dehydrogenase small subunit
MKETVMIEPQETFEIACTINGGTVRASVPVRQHLADFLRERMGLTGTHIGCEHGVCGACTVLLDGEPVRGCLVLAVQADARCVETIEGAVASGRVKDLIDAFEQRNAAQCGFCSPSMILTAADLLARVRNPSRTEVREQIAGSYCRCTGYEAIVDAVMNAVSRAEGTNPQESK